MTATRCQAWALVAGTEVTCELPDSHSHEHECTSEAITVPVGTVETETDDIETPFIVWWSDEGDAFVGSDRAVNTGRIK